LKSPDLVEVMAQKLEVLLEIGSEASDERRVSSTTDMMWDRVKTMVQMAAMARRAGLETPEEEPSTKDIWGIYHPSSEESDASSPGAYPRGWVIDKNHRRIELPHLFSCNWIKGKSATASFR